MIKFLSKFLYIIAGQKSRLIFLILLFLITSVLDTIGIKLIRRFIALASAPDSIHKTPWLNSVYVQSGLSSEAQLIAFLGIIITFIFYAKSFLTFWVQKYVVQFSYSQEGDLAKRLLRAYLTAPYHFI